MLRNGWTVLLALAVRNLAAPSITTRYVQVDTTTQPIAPGATDTNTDGVRFSSDPPLTEMTATANIVSTEQGLTIVELVVPNPASGALASDPWTSTTSTAYRLAATATGYIAPSTETSFLLYLTYTAPPSCSSQWTFHTRIDAYYSPGASSASALTTTPGYDQITIFTNSYGIDAGSAFYVVPAVVLLQPTDLADFSFYSSFYSPPWSTECTIPENSFYLGGKSSGQDDEPCNICNVLDNWRTIVVSCTLGWLGLFFIFGLYQSWLTFRDLSLGLAARRGLPTCWVCLCCPLSCLIIGFSRRGFRARTETEQTYLEHRWKALPCTTRLYQWLRWGFRLSYPPFFGTAPERIWAGQDGEQQAGRSRRAMQQRSTSHSAPSEADDALATDGEPLPPYTPHDPAISTPEEAIQVVESVITGEETHVEDEARRRACNLDE